MLLLPWVSGSTLPSTLDASLSSGVSQGDASSRCPQCWESSRQTHPCPLFHQLFHSFGQRWSSQLQAQTCRYCTIRDERRRLTRESRYMMNLLTCTLSLFCKKKGEISPWICCFHSLLFQSLSSSVSCKGSQLWRYCSLSSGLNWSKSPLYTSSSTNC